MEREVGGGIGMGNTCKPMAVSFQCMTKSTTIKKNNNCKKKKKEEEKTLHVRKSCPKNTHFIKEQEDYIREKLPCLTTHLFWDNQKFSFSSQV